MVVRKLAFLQQLHSVDFPNNRFIIDGVVIPNRTVWFFLVFPDLLRTIKANYLSNQVNLQ